MLKISKVSEDKNSKWLSNFAEKFFGPKEIKSQKKDESIMIDEKKKDRITKLSWDQAQKISLVGDSNYHGFGIFSDKKGVLDLGSIWTLETDESGKKFLIKKMDEVGNLVRKIKSNIKKAELNKKADVEEVIGYEYENLPVTLDNQNYFNAYIILNEDWNGFAIPYFEKEEAEKVAKNNSDDWSYDESSDEFSIKLENDEVEKVGGEDINIDGEKKHVYGIGARAWTWIPKEKEIESNRNISIKKIATFRNKKGFDFLKVINILEKRSWKKNYANEEKDIINMSKSFKFKGKNFDVIAKINSDNSNIIVADDFHFGNSSDQLNLFQEIKKQAIYDFDEVDYEIDENKTFTDEAEEFYQSKGKDVPKLGSEEYQKMKDEWFENKFKVYLEREGKIKKAQDDSPKFDSLDDANKNAEELKTKTGKEYTSKQSETDPTKFEVVEKTAEINDSSSGFSMSTSLTYILQDWLRDADDIEVIKKIEDALYESEKIDSKYLNLERTKENDQKYKNDILKLIETLNSPELFSYFGIEKHASEKSTKAPEKWWGEKYKEVQKGNKSYSEEQVQKTVGKIWSDLSDSEKSKIREREGKTYGEPKEKKESQLNKKASYYRFLEYLAEKEPTSKGYYELINLPEAYNGTMWASEEKLQFAINIDSKKIVDNYLSFDKKMTDKIRKEIGQFEDIGSWADQREAWIESKKWKAVNSGNTYNNDEAYFWGSTFEWTEFDTDKGENGAIILWHMGGDVRGNYEPETIYFGDFQDFFAAQYFGDAEEEIAYLLGYEGNYDQLKKDVGDWLEGKESTYVEPDPNQQEFDFEKKESRLNYTKFAQFKNQKGKEKKADLNKQSREDDIDISTNRYQKWVRGIIGDGEELKFKWDIRGKEYNDKWKVEAIERYLKKYETSDRKKVESFLNKKAVDDIPAPIPTDGQQPSTTPSTSDSSAPMTEKSNEAYNITVLITGKNKTLVDNATQTLQQYDLSEYGIDANNPKALTQDERGYVLSWESPGVSKDKVDELSLILSELEHQLQTVEINLGATQSKGKKSKEKENVTEEQKELPKEFGEPPSQEKKESQLNKKADSYYEIETQDEFNKLPMFILSRINKLKNYSPEDISQILSDQIKVNIDPSVIKEYLIGEGYTIESSLKKEAIDPSRFAEIVWDAFEKAGRKITDTISNKVKQWVQSYGDTMETIRAFIRSIKEVFVANDADPSDVISLIGEATYFAFSHGKLIKKAEGINWADNLQNYIKANKFLDYFSPVDISSSGEMSNILPQIIKDALKDNVEGKVADVSVQDVEQIASDTLGMFNAQFDDNSVFEGAFYSEASDDGVSVILSDRNLDTFFNSTAEKKEGEIEKELPVDVSKGNEIEKSKTLIDKIKSSVFKESAEAIMDEDLDIEELTEKYYDTIIEKLDEKKEGQAITEEDHKELKRQIDDLKKGNTLEDELINTIQELLEKEEGKNKESEGKDKKESTDSKQPSTIKKDKSETGLDPKDKSHQVNLPPLE